MRVQCDQCQAAYTLPEQRVAPGRRLQFQCRQCQHRIVVQVPDVAQPPAVAVATPLARVLWFVSAAGGQHQRMDIDGVRDAIAQGSVGRDTWVWRKGMAEWLRAGDCADLQPAFQAMASAEPQATLAMDLPLPSGPDAGAQVLELSRPAVVTGSHIAGTASVHKGAGHNTDQRAMALPVIKAPLPEAGDSEGVVPRPVLQPLPRSSGPSSGGPLRKRPTSPGPAVAAAEPSQGDAPGGRDEAADERRKWSPATDTYTGLRARLTRKVDDGQRNAAVEWADALDRQESATAALAQQVQVWRKLAVVSLCALAIVSLVAVLLALKWRSAASACAAPPQAVAP